MELQDNFFMSHRFAKSFLDHCDLSERPGVGDTHLKLNGFWTFVHFLL